jgi:hypothetical protein
LVIAVTVLLVTLVKVATAFLNSMRTIFPSLALSGAMAVSVVVVLVVVVVAAAIGSSWAAVWALARGILPPAAALRIVSSSIPPSSTTGAAISIRRHLSIHWDILLYSRIPK